MRWSLMNPRLQSVVLWGQSKGLLWLVQTTAAAAVAWIVAQGVWWLAEPHSARQSTWASPTLLEQGQHVGARHFFDVPTTSAPVNEAGESSQAGAVNSRWRLMGTYVGAGKLSRAVLALEDGSEVVVAKVGDVLFSGQEVVEVKPESVTLSKDAQQETLILRPDVAGSPEPNSNDNRFGPSGPPPSIKDIQ